MSTPPRPALSLEARSLLRRLAHFYLGQNCPARAATLLSTLEMHGCGDRDTLAALAWAELRRGAAQAAIAALDRMDADGESHAAAHLIRARSLAAQHRVEEAGTAMRSYIAANPNLRSRPGQR
jgi:hypothetical protein